MTGVRISELQAIEWAKIDFDSGTVLIDCSMYYKNQKEWYITDTKSTSGIRLLYLDDDTLKYLKDWKQIQLGHADIKTTLGTYSHLRPNAMKDIASRMTGQIVVAENNIRQSTFKGNQHTINLDSKI